LKGLRNILFGLWVQLTTFLLGSLFSPESNLQAVLLLAFFLTGTLLGGLAIAQGIFFLLTQKPRGRNETAVARFWRRWEKAKERV